MKKILVVDDSAVMRELISAALQTGGYRVLLANHGLAALQLAQEEDVDLVLTDWNMPTMDGLQLIRALRQLPAYSATPILVLTTETSSIDKDEARSAGASGWLRKPIEPAVLLEVADSLLLIELTLEQ